MQAALDSTALMLVKDLSDGKITVGEISGKATAYFNALYTNKDAKSVTINAIGQRSALAKSPGDV